MTEPSEPESEIVPLVEKVPSTLPNPNFFWGEDSFALANGDSYNGGYCCHKKGIVWREGQGIYNTKDGHIYEGQWENDQLLQSDDSKMKYPDGVEYTGPIVNGKYDGNGTYILDNKLTVNAEFKENKPLGDITLTDYEGHQWIGPAKETYALLLPVNHFFENIPDDRGQGKFAPKKTRKSVKIMEPKKTSSHTLRNLVFARSTKTNNDFPSTTVVREPSKSKDISLKANQIKGGKNISCDPCEKCECVKKCSSVSLTLLKTFLSKEYRNKCRPMKIIIPTVDQERMYIESLEADKEPENKNPEEEELNPI